MDRGKPRPLSGAIRYPIRVGSARLKRFHGANDRVVKAPAACDHTAVFGERRALRKIERLPIDVGDLSACLFNDERSRGMIPDLLLVAFSGREAEVNARIAAR